MKGRLLVLERYQNARSKSVKLSEKVGELCTRGYSTMLGYWGDDERTQEVNLCLFIESIR